MLGQRARELVVSVLPGEKRSRIKTVSHSYVSLNSLSRLLHNIAFKVIINEYSEHWFAEPTSLLQTLGSE